MDYALKTSEQLRQQIRSLRKKRRITQAQLGQLIGVTQARVVEIEANPGSVSFQQIMQVLSVLGASLVIRDSEFDAAPDEGSQRLEVPAGRIDIGTKVPEPKTKKGSW